MFNHALRQTTSPAPANQARPSPLYAQVRQLRWLAPAVIVAAAALHQVLIRLLVTPTWQGVGELLLFSVSGTVVTWLALTWIANAIARQSETEERLRQAFAELEFNHQKLLAMHDLEQRVTAATDEQAVLALAAQAPLQLTNARASTVITFDEDRDRLNLDMAWGLSDRYLSGLRRRLDGGVAAGRCRTCQVLRTEASSDCPLFVDLHDLARDEGINSLICLPIHHEQERVGVISAYFPSADGPPEDHIRLLNILGTSIAATLESLRARVRQVGALHALDRATQSPATVSHDQVSELAAQVLDITAAGWQAQTGGLFLFDTARQMWTCQARRDLGADVSDPRFGLALEMAAQAYAAGAPVMAPELGASAGGGLLSAAAAPLAAEGQVFGAIFLGARRRRAFSQQHSELLTTMAHQIALAIRHAQLLSQVSQMAVLEERYRLSREIHDGLAQTLGYLGLQAERLEQLIHSGRQAAAMQELGELRQSIRGAYVDVREAIDGLRLTAEKPGAITACLADYTADFARQTGIAAQFSAEPPGLETNATTGFQLLRIAQEALTNVRKHAQARQVTVALRAEGDHCTLAITDDGRGFPKMTDPSRIYRSHGLASMRERAEGLGGALTIATGPDQGTRLAVTVPLTTPV
jgi:nitrate/nitrite-specific signal transduction histidine kinase